MKLLLGDCLEQMKTLEADSIDAVVTDPPYGISFMGKAWDGKDIQAVMQRKMRKGTARPDGWERHDGQAFAAGTYDLSSKGLLAFQLWTEEWAAESLRVLKPGGHLLSFASPRTYHRMATGIEDAGFEIRDQIMWVFGSGFPKSLNVGKAIDGLVGANRKAATKTVSADLFAPGREITDSKDWVTGGGNSLKMRIGERKVVAQVRTLAASAAAKQWDGYGTALKPAHEPIVLARKPLEGTVAENVLKHGVGGLNVDGCRVGTEGARNNGRKADSAIYGKMGPTEKINYGMGRWPANLIHDGSDEVLEAFPQTESGQPCGIKAGGKLNCYGEWAGGIPVTGFGDSGSAARFFYCAKASKADRDEGCDGLTESTAAERVDRAEGSAGMDSPRAGAGRPAGARNSHPTVKPTELMRYLCRLITPPGGTVLDPFMGSGSTGKAAVLEGFGFVGIERDPGYMKIAEARVAVAPALRAEEQRVAEPPPLLGLMADVTAAKPDLSN